jgi:hypothetical protein
MRGQRIEHACRNVIEDQQPIRVDVRPRADPRGSSGHVWHPDAGNRETTGVSPAGLPAG